MGLEKTFGEFGICLQRLDDRLKELGLTMELDRPERNDASVVDVFEYAVLDLCGWVKETLHHARIAEKSVRHTLEMEKARHALIVCQERFQRIEELFFGKLVSYDDLNELINFGAERRGEWRSWVTSVRKGIELCREPLEDARKKLAECWQEITERVGMMTVSVQNTSIGQNIISKAPETEQASSEEMA